MVTVEVAGTTYHMNPNLKKNWDKIKDGNLKRLDEDRSYVVDGRERTGKSLFTLQQAAYIDDEIVEDQKDGVILPRIPMGDAKSWEENSEWRTEAVKRFKEGTLLPQITFDTAETLKSIRFYRSTPTRTKVVTFDEAFRGMSSKGVLSKENKKLTQAIMEMGQNNLVMFVVSPSFYMLELYPAMIRTNCLFHVKKDKNSGKRIVRIFNFSKKAKLYQVGLKKGWSYPIFTRDTAQFYNKYPAGQDFEWRYRLKKQLSLMEVDVKEEKEEHKWKKQRDFFIKEAYNKEKSLMKTSKYLKSIGINMSPEQIRLILKEKGWESDENNEDDGENVENEPKT